MSGDLSLGSTESHIGVIFKLSVKFKILGKNIGMQRVTSNNVFAQDLKALKYCMLHGLS